MNRAALYAAARSLLDRAETRELSQTEAAELAAIEARIDTLDAAAVRVPADADAEWTPPT